VRIQYKDKPHNWIVEWPSRLTPLVDLLCFPGAGAGASLFTSWMPKLPAFVSLIACQLPGREGRIDEQLSNSLGRVADAATAEYVALRPKARPLVLLGHSMGAVVAFEVASRLIEIQREPFAVVLAASTPPQHSYNSVPMDFEALKQLLLDFDPANREILLNEELFTSLAPALKSDIENLNRHKMRPASRLPIRAYLLAGKYDKLVPPAAVARWREHFTGLVSQRNFPGGHYFPMREAREEVIEFLTVVLREPLGCAPEV
jgi:medium-chain acyl-[acyl-carrier-protein] hydrolase